MDSLLPRLRVPTSRTGALAPTELLTGASEAWLEIGFGGGEHAVGQARRRPDVVVLASEVFHEGIAKCLGQIDEHGVENLWIWDEDARDLMAQLEAESVDRVFILFPDPWPKAKHHKRRLIQAPFLDELVRILKPGGQVRFATDVRHYADEAFARFITHPGFVWHATSAADWTAPPADHIQTRYESKNIGDIKPVYFDFEKAAKTAGILDDEAKL